MLVRKEIQVPGIFYIVRQPQIWKEKIYVERDRQLRYIMHMHIYAYRFITNIYLLCIHSDLCAMRMNYDQKGDSKT